MRGHGRSDAPLVAEAYESIRYAEDFKAVMEEFGVVKPFVAGWYFIEVLPERISNLIDFAFR